MNNLQNKKTIKLTLLAALMAAFSFQAAAEAIPRSSGKDSRRFVHNTDIAIFSGIFSHHNFNAFAPLQPKINDAERYRSWKTNKAVKNNKIYRCCLDEE